MDDGTKSWIPPGAPADELRALAILFLRLGTLSFGGPAAHVAMMEDEVVRRRRWLSREEFLDLLGATNLIPGPNSTELAIHIGYRRAGWRGLVVAGSCFILPAMALVMVLAWVYVRHGSLPALEGFLYGVKPVVMAVVVQAMWSLGKTALRTPLLATLAAGTAVATLLGVHELAALLVAGVIAAAARARASAGSVAPCAGLLFAPWVLAAGSTGTVGLGPLFLAFARIGSVLYGSGYVLLAFLRAEFVERQGWMTEQTLLDAVVVGQVTPGPVFTTATFIGYVLEGPWGACVATLGIFMPAFVFVALSLPLLPWLRRSRGTSSFLDGVNAASLALMAVVAVHLAGAALPDPLTAALAITSGVLLMRFRVHPGWLVVGGAIIGICL